METVSSFALKIYGKDSSANRNISKVRGFIQGKYDTFFNIHQIKRMCEIIGKPFEEVFKEREG